MNQYLVGDALQVLQGLPRAICNCCVTSPPYWGLRDYGISGQIGLESMPSEYVRRLVEVFREVRRVLRDDGTLWLNLGDCYASQGGHTGQGQSSQRQGRSNVAEQNRGSYSTVVAGLKPKDLVGIPWMVAFALRADGWYLRSEIVWSKPNSMPESVTDRPTRAHEQVFLLSKRPRYYYDKASVDEPAVQAGRVRADKMGGNKGDDVHHSPGKVFTGSATRNLRSVWTVPVVPSPEAHYATFPPKLVEPCILAGCPVGGVVLDPFGGSGTTGLVAEALGRHWLLIDSDARNVEIMQAKRVRLARYTK